MTMKKYLFAAFLIFIVLFMGSAESAADAVSVSDNINFAFFNAGETVQKILTISNSSSQPVMITSWIFGDPVFSPDSELPISLPVGTSSVKINIRPPSTGLYQSSMQLTCEIQGESQTVSSQISAGLFLEDGGETAYTAHRALDAYNACYAADPDSIATRNNLGVLYRLLGEPPTAESYLMESLSDALNLKYGYTGIKMNMGVAKSDQNMSSEALEYYDLALTDISGTDESSSSLAPQIYYNRAWELFKNFNYSDSLTFVNQTISHPMTNSFLMAKALMLRGAIYFRQGDSSSADENFQQALNLDPNGPIGRLAQYNLVGRFCLERLIVILKILNGIDTTSFESVNMADYDMNQSDRIDMPDAILMLQYAAGMR